MTAFDLPGSLRRIRRIADRSQRELAVGIELSKSAVAAVESGVAGLDVRVFARAAELAGLRLTLLDANGAEVPPMADDTVRDLSGRRFPAHLDTLHSDEIPGWWEHNPGRPTPWFTAFRDRDARDAARRTGGVPRDHHPDRPGDSPEERKAARQRAARQRVREDFKRRLAAGGIRFDDFVCACPPACDELDDRSGKPVHAPVCPCDCDVA